MSLVLDIIRERARDPAHASDAEPIRAVHGTTALVFDSPHSGTRYPADFAPAVDLAVLRRAEDTHVEKLFDFAPALGIAWVEALFPRSYIDVNRAESDVDPAMLDGPWPGPRTRAPDALAKLRLGKGLVWRLTDEGQPIYDRPLAVEAVRQRIERCWRPYHAAVRGAIEAAHARHGFSIHLDCHSMPAVAASHATLFPGEVHPDFVLGDRDGTTAHPRLAQGIADFLRGRGYSVAINHPYKGVELVRAHGDPARHRHSVQLEINRQLYMNEESLALHEGAGPLRRHLAELAAELLRMHGSDL